MLAESEVKWPGQKIRKQIMNTVARSVPPLSGKRWTGLRGEMLTKKTVLVAEDSDGFYFMVQRAFAAAKLPHMLRRVRDGAEALSYVMGRERFADRQHFPFPD